MILVYGLTGLMVAFVVLWYAWPDLCWTGDDEDPDDLPSIGDAIDNAIALAATLPPEPLQLTKRDTPSRVAEVWGGMAEREYMPRIDTPSRDP